MFDGGKLDLRAITSHNTYKAKEAGPVQKGISSMLVYGNLLQQHDSEGSERDELLLGRWTHMHFQGEDDFVTRVICRYNPAANRKLVLGSTYHQHRHFYIDKQNRKAYPQTRFVNDFMKQLKA